MLARLVHYSCGMNGNTQTGDTRNKNGVTEYYRGTFLGLSVWSPAPWQSVEPETDSTLEVEHERIGE